MTDPFDLLPSDLAAAHALILAARAAPGWKAKRAQRAPKPIWLTLKQPGSSAEALIARLRLEIEKTATHALWRALGT